MALNFDISDPKNQRIIAMILVPVVACYVFFHFIIKPKMAELETKKAQVETLQNRVNNIRRTLQMPEKLNNEKAALTAKYEELEQLLPNEENVSLLLDQFSVVEHDAKVYMIGFEASETVDDGNRPYRENKYKVTVEAGFHQYAKFMSEIMMLPRILSISELNFSLTDFNQAMREEIYEGLEDQPRYLTVECTLSSYVFKSLSEPEGEGGS